VAGATDAAEATTAVAAAAVLETHFSRLTALKRRNLFVPLIENCEAPTGA
jgi:hypothetical protein